MNDIVESVRQQSTDDCVSYAEFLLQYKKGADVLYCFFEGHEDRTFYPIRIEGISQAEGYADYVCCGKDAVKKVHSLIKSHVYYKTVKTGFFVDRDFDNEQLDESIYVTPTYSIENLYCFNQSFEKILKAEFKMNPLDDDFKICVANYTELLNAFNKKLLVLNAWLACQADYRNRDKINTRLNIDKTLKKHFEKIVSTDLKNIEEFSIFKSKEDIEKLFEGAHPITTELLSEKIDSFTSANHLELFRGKFLIFFLTSYLGRLQSIFGTKYSFFEKRYTCSLRFEYVTICTTLSQYAVTSDCLKQYIGNISSNRQQELVPLKN